jgi:hypothetical protein
VTLKDQHWTSASEQMTQDALLSVITAWEHAHALQVTPINNVEALDHSIEIHVTLQGESLPRQFILLRNENLFSLIDTGRQLRYDFPAKLFPSFFPDSP